MEKIILSDNLKCSRLIHGHWRLNEWKMSSHELLKLTEQLIELGITSFDHADIYGDYRCEKIFGDALALKKEVRDNIQIITKCGIKLQSDKYPERKINSYDYSSDHIISSVNTSLKNFRTETIDLLLLHRPAPFIDPEEVAKAFDQLKDSGKVLNFGVSNFTPLQFEMLNSKLNVKLITNQVEISPFCLEHFKNGNIAFFLQEGLNPLAWSPLSGGKLMNPKTDKEQRISHTLEEIAEELNVEFIDQIIINWLLKHPACILPIIGTGKIQRIKNAVRAFDIDMSLEQWYRIYIASEGHNLP